ncbi:MAG: hypothetical protein J4N29_01055 [Chloroflexi bacterium]|nr:hypothetical protein [Chloroflexota bacterium]
MRSRWLNWTLGLLVGSTFLLVLAACGADATATPRPTATAVPPTATPGPTATPLPPGATAPPPTATPTPLPPDPTATPQPGWDAAEYFRGKTIRLVANSSPGGGTDTQGRVMASFLSKWIPGNPRVVFTNSPNKPLAYVFSGTRAPKDGTYIAWTSTPQFENGYDADTQFIKQSSFNFLGATIDSTRSWMTYKAEENLGPGAGDKCLWDFAGLGVEGSTGGGKHEKFLQADEISDVRDGDTTVIGNILVLEWLDIPFRYFAFDQVDTNAVRTMWARGDINSTTRASLWYRFPFENPSWLPDGTIRVMAGMGPGQLGPNAWGEPQCGDIREHLKPGEVETYNQVTGPANYASKTLWLPPGTPEDIVNTLADAFERAFTEDTELISKYGAVAGEIPNFTPRSVGQRLTEENEVLFAASRGLIADETERILQKYFPQYIQ